MSPQWKAQVLRFTIFLSSPPLKSSLESLWQLIGGGEIDRVQSVPKRQLHVLQATMNDHQVVVQTEVDRLDIIFQASEVLFERGVSELGPFEAKIEQFNEFVQKWLALDGWPDANRVAVAARMFVETPSEAEAYQVLFENVPCLKIEDASNISDFMFQINRPRTDQVQGAEIQFNRLAKWTVAKLVGAVFGPTAEMTHINTTNMTLLELDLNTAAEMKLIFDSDAQSELVDYLVDLATEIGEKGDVA